MELETKIAVHQVAATLTAGTMAQVGAGTSGSNDATLADPQVAAHVMTTCEVHRVYYHWLVKCLADPSWPSPVPAAPPAGHGKPASPTTPPASGSSPATSSPATTPATPATPAAAVQAVGQALGAAPAAVQAIAQTLLDSLPSKGM